MEINHLKYRICHVPRFCTPWPHFPVHILKWINSQIVCRPTKCYIFSQKVGGKAKMTTPGICRLIHLKGFSLSYDSYRVKVPNFLSSDEWQNVWFPARKVSVTIRLLIACTDPWTCTVISMHSKWPLESNTMQIVKQYGARWLSPPGMDRTHNGSSHTLCGHTHQHWKDIVCLPWSLSQSLGLPVCLWSG